jgi:site-specific recombinase XerD
MNIEKAVARLTEVIRRKHLALATERSYCAWLRRYCDNLKRLPSHLSSEQKLERFLNALAQENVAASTQNQAFNAIVFFYKAPTPRGEGLIMEETFLGYGLRCF